MPINVICPSCHARFSVAEKFAGQTGPCPKCKGKITIPKLEDQVVIHAPDHSESGAVGAGGRHVLKTYKRKETKFQPLVFTAVLGAVLVGIMVALVFRSTGEVNEIVKIVGAIILGPPLAWAGYTFLRDPELEAYQGTSVVIRSLACGLVYALLWGVYWWVGGYIGGPDAFTKGMEIYQLLIVGVLTLGIGTFAAYVSFDLEPGSAAFHAALYFGVTVLLRVIAGLPALPGLGAA